ncbi:type II and III secretion system protein family protein [Polynucleobacter sp. MWH-Mekk-B1]|uniref:type II and III secretion system protein family protein n=1 Tax=Polynucleobacter finlandensis TaxID=1855894 RepID=UPI001C0CB940|nr:type II and III secretion system protein family protein [Polynucleobacter finlandensis]MBU3545436.1 type II and III secretion system protein family protein [Polynucleobacter finlandensis]
MKIFPFFSVPLDVSIRTIFKKITVVYLTLGFLSISTPFSYVSAQEVKVNSEMPAPMSAPAPNELRSSVPLTVGKTFTYTFRAPVTRISIANPAIADVLTATATDVQLLGKKSGSTNLTAWYRDGGTTTFDVFVGGDTNYLQGLFKQLLSPGNSIQITPAGESIVLSGKAKDAETVQKAVRISEEATGRKVLNMLSTEDLPQVLLEVKIAEIDKTVADALGIAVGGTNFSYNILGGTPSASSLVPTGFAAVGAGAGAASLFLQANETNGLVKILAEPNIMAISGQEGNFLSGGTIYLPVPQSGGTNGGTVITLQAVQYGIGVRFTPTVLGGGKINLRVAPQVSDVSPNGFAITANGQTQVVPQIKSRNASTTVQLEDGQTFAIGGLISNNVQESIAAFPWLASLPIIGALFRSSSFNASRSELIILVTPHIVKPLANKPATPTDSYVQPSFNEFFLNGKMEGSKPSPTSTNQEAK